MTSISDKIQDVKNLSGIYRGAGGDRIPPHGTTHAKNGTDPIPQQVDGIPIDLDGMTEGQTIVFDIDGNLVPGVSPTTLQETYDKSGVVQLSSGDPLSVLDLDDELVLLLSSTSNEGAITNVNSFGTLEGYSSTTTIKGDILNLNDGNYSKTLTEIVEEIAANTSDISDLQTAVNRSLTPNVITFTADDQNADFLVTDAYEQLIEGDYSNCSMNLPAANGAGMFVGWSITVVNNTGKFVVIYNSDKSKSWFISHSGEAKFECLSIATAAGEWKTSFSNISLDNGYDRTERYAVESIFINSTSVSGAASGVLIVALNDTLTAGCRTGSTSTGYARIRYQESTPHDGGNGSFLFQKQIAYNALSNAVDEYAAVFGWGDQTSGAALGQGVYIIYDRGNVFGLGGDGTKYKIVCVDGSGTTSSVSSVTASTEMQKYTIVQSALNRVDFYVDGILLGSLTTNIPSLAIIYPTNLIVKSAGTGIRISYFRSTRMASTLNPGY